MAKTLTTKAGEQDNIQDNWSGVLVYAEFSDNTIAPVVFELLGAGRILADELQVPLSTVLIGSGVRGEADSLIAVGADIVHIADDLAFSGYREDIYSRVLTALIRRQRPEIVLAGATAIGRSLIPAAGASLGTGLTADCIELSLHGPDRILRQTKPAFSDNVMAVIECLSTRPQMTTIRPGVMASLEPDESRRGRIFDIKLSEEMIISQLEILEQVIEEQNQVDIQETEILVGVGRGIENEKGLALARELADGLGGSLAGTRAVVDEGLLPHAAQIGQTGKTVSPKLYIACGISGAVQHTVGIGSAETIVAVNRDANAPIFDFAKWGIVGDYFEIIPMLTEKIREAGKK